MPAPSAWTMCPTGAPGSSFSERAVGAKGRGGAGDGRVARGRAGRLGERAPGVLVRRRAGSAAGQSGIAPGRAPRRRRPRRVRGPVGVGVGREVVRTEGLEPSLPYGKRIFVPPRLSPPSRRDVCKSGLSLRHSRPKDPALGAARLVSTPSRPGKCLPRAGLARDQRRPRRTRRRYAFPEFEQFYSPHFHGGTQVDLKSVASTDFATSALPVAGRANPTAPADARKGARAAACRAAR